MTTGCHRGSDVKGAYKSQLIALIRQMIFFSSSVFSSRLFPGKTQRLYFKGCAGARVPTPPLDPIHSNRWKMRKKIIRDTFTETKQINK